MSSLKEIQGETYLPCIIAVVGSDKPAQEDDMILIKKLFSYNLVKTNSTSLDENQIRDENVLSTLNRIDDTQNGMWSTEGWHIRDLYDAGLIETQYMYFLCDIEITSEDWVFDTRNGYVFKPEDIMSDWVTCRNFMGVEGIDKKYVRKIIASNNPELKLPKPSDYFISEYIRSRSKGKPIKEILLRCEYKDVAKWARNEDDTYDCVTCGKENFEREDDCNCQFYHLIVDDKDNIISTKNVQENYSRDEVIALLRTFGSNCTPDSVTEEWIKDNL